MKYFDLYASYPDPTIAAARDSRSKRPYQTPFLAETLTDCESETHARFAACYAELRALPRSARRALQRRIARSSQLAARLPKHLRQGGRRLQHRMAWSLAGAALLLTLGQEPVTAATITVTTNNPNIAADGQCSLVEAIINANNDAATHADCSAGSGADTIVLPANANITLSSANGTLDHVTVGVPSITSVITLEGNGAIVNRQANASAFALLAVSTPGDLTLRAVTLSGGTQGGVYNRGKLNIQNSTISGHVGRGISNINGTVTITNSTIVGNMGGGLYSAYGHLTIENSTISDNAANYSGGGVDISGGTTTIANSTISNNTTQGFGGGLAHGIGYYVPILLAITNSTISGNTAKKGGGGISNYGGVIAITNSTIANNLTEGRGGGLSNGVGFGGPGAFTIANSTISGNRAIEGGGVFNKRGCAYGPCLSPAITLSHSLITGNESASGREIASQGNDFTANNFNLFGYNGDAGVTGFTPGPTDIVPSVSLAQILGPLQNNGGPTQTHALVAGSPAIDAGNPGGCRDSLGVLLQTDQRGFLRLDDGNHDGTSRCDIGAYELTNILAVSSSTFVRQQYLDFLDRQPEAAGLSGWVNALDGGLPRASLIEAFMDSEEFFSKGKFIAQTYLGLLTRDADFSGFRAWLEVLLAGVSHEQIVQWFLDSDEFTIRFGSSLTNSQFIERMYNNVLLRSADPGGFNLWVGQLTSGQLTRAQVALGFLDSDEFQKLSASQNEIDVSLLYFSMLRRDPDPGGFAGWVGVLNSGVPLNSVIDGFLNSPEYQAGF